MKVRHIYNKDIKMSIEIENLAFPKFLNQLAKDLNKFYKKKVGSNFIIKNKGNTKKFNPVTTFDKAFEKLIRKKISQNFPDHKIIGEEFKTKNKGRSIFGFANFPELDKYYYNKSNSLAYVVEKGKRRKINVNNKSKFSEMKLAGEFHGWLNLNKQKKIPKVLQLMQFPSSDALSYVNFCEGRIDSVIQCVNKIWDIHAIIPIIKASGGIASTWNNKDPKNAGTILVSSNATIHNKMLGYLKPLSKFVPGRVN